MMDKDYQIYSKQFTFFDVQYHFYNLFLIFLKNIFILHFKLRFGLVNKHLFKDRNLLGGYFSVKCVSIEFTIINLCQINLLSEIFIAFRIGF